MGDGRKTEAPCGHLGEVIIGTYVQCRSCDSLAVPGHIEHEDTEPVFWVADLCPGCGSSDIEEFETDVDAAFWYMQQAMTPSTGPMPPQANDWHCWDCGKLFGKPS